MTPYYEEGGIQIWQHKRMRDYLDSEVEVPKGPGPGEDYVFEDEYLGVYPDSWDADEEAETC